MRVKGSSKWDDMVTLAAKTCHGGGITWTIRAQCYKKNAYNCTRSSDYKHRAKSTLHGKVTKTEEEINFSISNAVKSYESRAFVVIISGYCAAKCTNVARDPFCRKSSKRYMLCLAEEKHTFNVRCIECRVRLFATV